MTRHLTKILLAASALTVLAAAPAASAAPAVDTKLHSIKHPLKAKATKTLKVADRSDRSRGKRHRSNRSRHRNYHSDRHRSDRHHRQRSDRGYRNRDRNYRHRNRSYRSNHYSRDYYRPHRRNYNRNYSPYRSNLGISFNFGSPRYSGYRWAPAAYSFYRPTYGSYDYYQHSTVCRRVNIEGWHHGHRELVSVKECSNPWDGTYIVQGSERVIDCRW